MLGHPIFTLAHGHTTRCALWDPRCTHTPRTRMGISPCIGTVMGIAPYLDFAGSQRSAPSSVFGTPLRLACLQGGKPPPCSHIPSLTHTDMSPTCRRSSFRDFELHSGDIIIFQHRENQASQKLGGHCMQCWCLDGCTNCSSARREEHLAQIIERLGTHPFPGKGTEGNRDRDDQHGRCWTNCQRVPFLRQFQAGTGQGTPP